MYDSIIHLKVGLLHAWSVGPVGHPNWKKSQSLNEGWKLFKKQESESSVNSFGFFGQTLWKPSVCHLLCLLPSLHSGFNHSVSLFHNLISHSLKNIYWSLIWVMSSLYKKHLSSSGSALQTTIFKQLINIYNSEHEHLLWITDTNNCIIKHW